MHITYYIRVLLLKIVSVLVSVFVSKNFDLIFVLFSKKNNNRLFLETKTTTKTKTILHRPLKKNYEFITMNLHKKDGRPLRGPVYARLVIDYTILLDRLMDLFLKNIASA